MVMAVNEREKGKVEAKAKKEHSRFQVPARCTTFETRGRRCPRASPLPVDRRGKEKQPVKRNSKRIE